MKLFGSKIRALRTARNLSLRELSKLLGHNSHSYITNIENGSRKPSAEIVIKLADIFGITTDELLRDELDIENRL